MFKSLRARLIVIYSLILILTVLAVDLLLLKDYLESRLEERRITFFTYANMASNAVSRNISHPLYVVNILEEYTESTGARFLFINRESRVVADGMHQLQGQLVTNPQVREALGGNESWGLYGSLDKTMQLAVPVLSGNGDSAGICGVILVSASLDQLYTSFNALRWRVIVISAIAALFGILVSSIAGYSLSMPIKKLIKFSRGLSSGHLGEKIDIKRKDEIGQLADTINTMSAELYRIDKNRRRFIGSVSHELKTPLASVKALAESLLMGERSREEYREFLRDIISEIDRLSSLVKRLLTFTRLEEETVSKQVHCISDIVEDTVRVMTPLARSQQVVIKKGIKERVKAACDKNLFKEMLVNLIDNAIKYRDKQKELNLVYINDTLDSGIYSITVSDNGIGISREDLPHIFEGFYRSDPSRSRGIEGHGMGLAIVKRIAELHRWDIKVDSTPGVGTSITIGIPVNLKNI